SIWHISKSHYACQVGYLRREIGYALSLLTWALEALFFRSDLDRTLTTEEYARLLTRWIASACLNLSSRWAGGGDTIAVCGCHDRSLNLCETSTVAVRTE